MVLLLPLLSFLLGFFAVRYLAPFRTTMAMILSKLLIPLVIIYNMVFYQQGSFWLMLFSFLGCLTLYSVFSILQGERIRALCLSYLNMAWLGFPFALAIFGTAVTSPMVALYIGGSIFGNIWAIIALGEQHQSWRQMVVKVLLSPPILALSIAGLLSFWDFSAYEQHALVQLLYQWDKWLMTFTGMCILGMWLSKIRIQWSDIVSSLKYAVIRIALGAVLGALAYYFLPIPHHAVIQGVMLMFFLLPPAANIVALETHYLGTGHSARYIAAGTLASCITIGLFGLLYHIWF